MIRSFAAVVGAAAISAALSGCSSSGHPTTKASTTTTQTQPSSTAPTTFDLAGTLTLYGSISTGVDAMSQGAPCIGILNPSFPDEDFEDIAPGTQVTVVDGTGATVGLGELTGGSMTTVNPPNARVCEFHYSISGIQAGKGFYSMRIGSHATQQQTESTFRDVGDLSLKSALYSA